MSSQIVPSLPGFFVVLHFAENDEVEVCDPVIAWRVDTYHSAEGQALSKSTPITPEGDPPPNCIGVENPNKTVSVFGGPIFQSLAELQAQWHRSKSARVSGTPFGV